MSSSLPGIFPWHTGNCYLSYTVSASNSISPTKLPIPDFLHEFSNQVLLVLFLGKPFSRKTFGSFLDSYYSIIFIQKDQVHKYWIRLQHFTQSDGKYTQNKYFSINYSYQSDLYVVQFPLDVLYAYSPSKCGFWKHFDLFFCFSKLGFM